MLVRFDLLIQIDKLFESRFTDKRKGLFNYREFSKVGSDCLCFATLRSPLAASLTRRPLLTPQSLKVNDPEPAPDQQQ